MQPRVSFTRIVFAYEKNLPVRTMQLPYSDRGVPVRAPNVLAVGMRRRQAVVQTPMQQRLCYVFLVRRPSLPVAMGSH